MSINSDYLKQRGGFKDRLHEEGPSQPPEYVELTNYFIDVLRDDFCNEEPDGYLSMKPEESTHPSA